MNTDDPPRDGPQWVRVRPDPRVPLAALVLSMLGGLLALGPAGDAGGFAQVWVWSLAAAIFGVLSAWLLAVMLVPTATEVAARTTPDLSSRRAFRQGRP